MNSRGFTLTELLVSMAIIGLVMAGLLTLQQQGQLAYLIGSARVDAQQNARAGLERLLTELRTASVIAAAPNCDNAATGATSIQFTFVDEVGASITVQYDLNAGRLRRNQTAPVPVTPQPEVVIAGVGGLRIWCHDAAGALTAVLINVRSVRVAITTTEDIANASTLPPRVTVESRVRLRNAT